MTPPPAYSRVEKWIKAHGADLLMVARAFTRDADEAEDLLQEVWLIAMRRQHDLREERLARSWLYRIVVNLGRTRARQAQRRRQLLEGWWRWASPQPEPQSASSIEGEQVRRLIWQGISELPELQQQCLLLRLVEGLSTAEAARAVHRAEGTVKVSLHRALKRLRERLGKHGVDPSILGGL